MENRITHTVNRNHRRATTLSTLETQVCCKCVIVDTLHYGDNNNVVLYDYYYYYYERYALHYYYYYY